MSKNKIDIKTVEHNVTFVGNALLNMVAAPGIKKAKDVSRAESAALSFGLSIGIGIGYKLATSSKWRKRITSVDDEPLTKEGAFGTAARIFAVAIDDLPEHRNRMLAVSGSKPGTVKITIEQDGEVR